MTSTATAAPDASTASPTSPAVDITSSQTPPDTSTAKTTKPVAKKVAVPPPGFKFVKVRKPDGTIVTVKRKLSPEEQAAQEATVNESSESSTSKTKPSQNETAKSPTAVSPTTTTVTSSQASPTHSPTSPSTSTATATRSVDNNDAQQAEQEAASGITQADLDEQAARFREKRMSRFKNGMIRGLANVVAHSLPSIDIGDWHHDDEEVDIGDSDSDIDMDDDDHDDHDGTDHGHNDDHHDSNGHNVTFNSGVAANAAAAALTAPGQQPAPPPRSAQPAEKNAKKETYNLNIKELNNIEQKAEETERPLKRHWANFSFYLMASLSIILPLLFLLLALFIVLMNGKSTTSNWHKMENAIKVAVSAWPIVFAAVVAQVFKAFATFRVERGIKLMELEQLVGSNSFGNAMKQPFLLRRLDILTLALFLVWCLSPLGSQALQRCYYTEQADTTWTNETIHYLDTTRPNQLFSTANVTNLEDSDFATKLQLVSTYFQAAFLPQTATEIRRQNEDYTNQDAYDNPMIGLGYIPAGNSDYNNWTYAAAYGVSFSLPSDHFSPSKKGEDQIKDPNSQWDQVEFTMTNAYYNLSCGNWEIQPFSVLNKSLDFWFTDNFESAFSMVDDFGQNRSNYLAFASLNRDPTSKDTALPASTADFSLIECTYHQSFVDASYSCWRENSDSAGLMCYVTDIDWTKNPPETQPLMDFAEYFMEGTNSGGNLFLTSSTEKFLLNGTLLDDPYNRNENFTLFNLSSTITTQDFEFFFGYAFNTWITLGFCPECIDANGQNYFPNERLYLYKSTNITHTFSTDVVYRLYIPWVVVYWVSCGLLLIAGFCAIMLEAMTVAPDVLGYVSSVARNSKYLHLPKTNSAMSAGERLQKLGGMEVMMQDVKADKDVGKIALGMKHDNAKRLQPNRLYR